MWAFDRITAKYTIKYTDKLSSLRMIHCEISTNYKFSQKLLENYSLSLDSCIYVGTTCFILVHVLKEQITTSENIPPQRREVVVSGYGNCFYQAVALWKDEISDERHEEIPRSSDSLFWIVLFEVSSGLGMRFLSYRFSPWRILSGKARSRELRQKLWTYHQLCIAL